MGFPEVFRKYRLKSRLNYDTLSRETGLPASRLIEMERKESSVSGLSMELICKLEEVLCAKEGELVALAKQIDHRCNTCDHMIFEEWGGENRYRCEMGLKVNGDDIEWQRFNENDCSSWLHGRHPSRGSVNPGFWEQVKDFLNGRPYP